MVDDETFTSRGEGIWSICEPFELLGARFGRRMVVVKRNGWTGIVTPGQHVRRSIEAGFGGDFPVHGLIALTAFHDTFFLESTEAYPDARRMVSAAFDAGVPDTLEVHAAWPDCWRDELVLYPIDGMPKVQETVVYDRANQTLIVSDLFFYFDASWDLWTKTFFRMAGAYGKPRMSRLFRLCIKDRAAFKRSLAKLLDLPIRQILPSHGKIVDRDCHRVLKGLLSQA